MILVLVAVSASCDENIVVTPTPAFSSYLAPSVQLDVLKPVTPKKVEVDGSVQIHEDGERILDLSFAITDHTMGSIRYETFAGQGRYSFVEGKNDSGVWTAEAKYVVLE